MLATLVLVSSLTLAPSQAGPLTLANPRPTYGVLGAVRKDTQIIAGDVFFLAFDIENLKMDDEGKVVYSMGMELINPKGESEYKSDPRDRPPIFNVLGGNRIPAFAHSETTADTMPGEYTLKVTVIDKATKPARTATLAQKFTVLKSAFGLVKLTTSYDQEGLQPAPFGGIVGQSLFVNFGIVGFERKKGQPNVTFEMRVFDEQGRPTVKKALSSEVSEGLPAELQMIPIKFILPLNRAGKYTIELKAKDAFSMKTGQLSFPVTVVEIK